MPTKPWTKPMPAAQFDFMREILAAPSPVGHEAAMTHGVLEPFFESIALPGWAVHRFRGNAGIVCDTAPDRDDLLKVMLIGHADKIRLQVRSISDDGKIWVDSDSFLPTTLIGHEVKLFSADPKKPGRYRVLEGGTIEAIGAIHFADPKLRDGAAGIKKKQLYLELQVHGDKPKKQIEALGIQPGDPIILKREIRRGFSPDTFYGAYLDNGLGCFINAELARLVARAKGLKNVRVLFSIATHEEVGRMGSRVLAGVLQPDVLIGVDVNHDYKAAPGIGDKRFNPLQMGQGFTIDTGSITSPQLNSVIQQAAKQAGVPFQNDLSGRDTGTDAMAGVFAGIDAASTSLAVPIRNMHTISETGHTGDVLATIHGLFAMLKAMDGANRGKGMTAEDFKRGHPRLDKVTAIKPAPVKAKKKK